MPNPLRLPAFVMITGLATGCTSQDITNPGWTKTDTGDVSTDETTHEQTYNTGWYVDFDQDGHYGNKDDCDDRDPNVHPGAVEDCGNLIDDDCDELIDGKDVDDCPPEDTGGGGDTGSSDGGTTDGGTTDGGTTDGGTTDGGTTAKADGIDWSRLAWCAPETESAGLRSYRHAAGPFKVHIEPT